MPKDLLPLKSKTLQWSSFRVDPTSRLRKSGCAFYNAEWNDDVPVVLSISGDPVELNNVLNNHFTLTKVAQFATRVEKELSPPGRENQEGECVYRRTCLFVRREQFFPFLFFFSCRAEVTTGIGRALPNCDQKK